MKKIFLAMMAVLAIGTISAKTNDNYGIKAPAFLKPGDKIAVISPGCTPQESTVEKGCEVLREWGFVPVKGVNVTNRYHVWAGTVDQRRADLMWALRDPSIKAIMCARGGYGTAQIFYGMPLDTIKKYDKWVIGYSDITALHSAEVRAGHMSIHGNMCGRLSETGGTDTMSIYLHNMLLGKLPTYKVSGHKYNVPGKAQGILIGGNLSVFTNMGGSETWDFLDRDFIKDKDVILFFEDVSENFAHVSQMFYQMKLKGVIDHVKGIIVGHFTEYSPDKGYNNMEEMLQEFLQGYNIPICYDFPTGHDENLNLPLIEGCPVELNVKTDKVTLKFKMPK